MSITEFLNARISEDEAVAREYQQYEDEVYETAGWFNCTRVLAECAAKRAIVAECRPSTLDDLDSGEDNQPAPMWIARTLAAIYAEHPEYQAEWRVGA